MLLDNLNAENVVCDVMISNEIVSFHGKNFSFVVRI